MVTVYVPILSHCIRLLVPALLCFYADYSYPSLYLRYWSWNDSYSLEVEWFSVYCLEDGPHTFLIRSYKTMMVKNLATLHACVWLVA